MCRWRTNCEIYALIYEPKTNCIWHLLPIRSILYCVNTEIQFFHISPTSVGICSQLHFADKTQTALDNNIACLLNENDEQPFPRYGPVPVQRSIREQLNKNWIHVWLRSRWTFNEFSFVILSVVCFWNDVRCVYFLSIVRSNSLSQENTRTQNHFQTLKS